MSDWMNSKKAGLGEPPHGQRPEPTRSPVSEQPKPQISDEKLADWYKRWPETLPTSVPHAQVRMLIEDLRTARATLDAERAELAAAIKERDEARAFGETAAKAHNELLASLTLTCAFCGQEYPPGTPPTQHGALAAHVRVCSEHPMREVERALAAAQAECAALRVPYRPADPVRAIASMLAKLNDEERRAFNLLFRIPPGAHEERALSPERES